MLNVNAYSTAFTTVDAFQHGLGAVDDLLRSDQRSRSHAIVRRETGGSTYFYLYSLEELLEQLAARSEHELLHSTLERLLDLHEWKQAPTITAKDAPSPGAVVIDGGVALGYVPIETPSPASDAVATLQAMRKRLFDASGLDRRSFTVRGGLDEYVNPAMEIPIIIEPPAMTPAGAASPTAPEPRFFNARTPDRVALNAQTYVMVQVSHRAEQSTDGTAAANSPLGDFSGKLTIDVHAPGLRADGPTTQTLDVPEQGDSSPMRFAFIAQRPGVHAIDVMAWNGSAQVAGLTLQIAVETETATVGANEARVDMDLREPEDGEYTLDVSMDDDSRRYRFQLRSDQKDVWPPMFSDPLVNDRLRAYDATISSLNAQARNLHDATPADQDTWLRGLGTLLFEQLVPDGLKKILLEHRHHIRVLNILSEADSTPWELLFLADPDNGQGDFLASTTTVARWRYGAGPGRALRRASKVFVLPKNAPDAAKEELQRLQRLLGAADTVGDVSSLNALLKTGKFDLLHFAAHHVKPRDAQEGGYVSFGKERWELPHLAAVPRNFFKSRAPLVFMNACTTSGTSAQYTAMAGWADRFLGCGIGAFIGTLWEVRDESARNFAETFYDELTKGGNLGDAMRAGRARLRAEDPGDPTPLAYTLYGNPLARLELA